MSASIALEQLNYERPSYKKLVDLLDQLKSALSSGHINHDHCAKIASSLIIWSSKLPLKDATYIDACMSATQFYLDRIILNLEDDLSLVDQYFYHAHLNQFRLLDWVVKAGSLDCLEYCFELLATGYAHGFISKEEYRHVVMSHPKEQYSILHELIIMGNLAKLKCYFSAVAALGEKGLITYQDYLGLFRCNNTANFSAMHQAINGPSFAVSQFLLEIVAATLNAQDEYLLLSSRADAPCSPRRANDKYKFNVINRQLQQQKGLLSEVICLQNSETPAVLPKLFDPSSTRATVRWATRLNALVSSTATQEALLVPMSPPASPPGFFRELRPLSPEQPVLPELVYMMSEEEIKTWVPSSMRSR